MTVLISTKLGEARNKQPRVWLEGRKLQREGIAPGMQYRAEFNFNSRKVTVHTAPVLANATGNVNKRTEKRTDQEIELPLMEIRSDDFLKMFKPNESLRVVVKDGVLIITSQVTTKDGAERLQRLREKLKNKQPLAVASLFHGGGVLDRALHTGLAKAGVDSWVQVAVELEEKYLESSLRNNHMLWRPESILFEGSIENFSPSEKSPKCDLLIAGIPCTGASLAGRAKNALAQAEDHEAAGACFYYTLIAIQHLNPSVVILENVRAFSSCASMSVIRNVLRSRGYNLQERIMSGVEFGVLEARERLCVVATTQGLDQFDLASVVPIRTKEATLGEVLDDIPLDSERYKTYEYLAVKEQRDIEQGKGFRRQLVTADCESVGVITKGYNKARSTDPYVIHPLNPKLSRLLTPTEHARVKGIPEDLIAGNSETTSHEILGQSVCYPVFESLGISLGGSLLEFNRECQTQRDQIQIAA